VSATNDGWKTWQSDNKIVPPTPYSVPLAKKLVVEQSTEVTLVLYAGRKGKQDLSLLFVYREVSGNILDAHLVLRRYIQGQGSPFHCTRITRSYEVVQYLQFSSTSHPSHSPDRSFLLSLDLVNVSSSSYVRISQVTTISASWSCSPLTELL